MKICSRCGKEKDKNEFSIDNRSKDGRYSWCRLCKSEYRNKNKEAINLKRKVYDSNHKEEKQMRDHLYYENNKEKLLNRNYVYCRNATYNITQKEFDAMSEKQGGVCAICGKEETSIGRVTKRRMPLSVDHDHNTGRIRGLLCKNCNHGLGSFFDNEFLLIEAANYLKYAHTNIVDEISVDVKTSSDTTWLENEGNTGLNLVVCGKCRTVVPPQMDRYQYKYCPNCGREITTKNTNPDYYNHETSSDNNKGE